MVFIAGFVCVYYCGRLGIIERRREQSELLHPSIVVRTAAKLSNV